MTLWDPMNCSTPDFPSFTISQIFSNSCQLSQWCYLSISFSVTPFSFCPQSFPVSGFFQWVSSSHQVAKVLELQFQHQSFQWTLRVDWKDCCWNWSSNTLNEHSGLISFRIDWFDHLCRPKDSQIFSSTTIWKHHFFGTQPSLWANSHICTWLLEKP